MYQVTEDGMILYNCLELRSEKECHRLVHRETEFVPDVKGAFVAHLHEALRSAGLNPFLDKISLRKGVSAFRSIDDAEIQWKWERFKSQ